MSRNDPSPPPRVLILDSDVESARALANQLAPRNLARIFIAPDAHAAIETHLHTPCDVLVADADLSDLDFDTLAARFRLMGAPPIIAICPGADPNRLVHLLRLRIHDVLFRPVLPPDLERAVRRQLALRRKRLFSRKRARMVRAELQRARQRGSALEHRLTVLSRDIVTAYRRLAARFGEPSDT